MDFEVAELSAEGDAPGVVDGPATNDEDDVSDERTAYRPVCCLINNY